MSQEQHRRSHEPPAGARYLTVRQTCERLNISRSTLHNLRKRGFKPRRLPGRGKRGMPVYWIKDIEAFERNLPVAR